MAAFSKQFFLVLSLIYGGWLLLIWLWPSSPYLLCFDDAFYYFEIARNVAHGFGPTFDRIHPTNGFHPLWLNFCIPVYRLGFEGLTAVRMLLSMQFVLWLGACWIIGHMYNTIVSPRLSATETPGHTSCEKGISRTVCVLFALIFCCPAFLKAYVNGLESAVYAVCYTMLLWQAVRVQGRFLAGTTRRQRLLLGATAALCFLARTDAVFLLLCLGCCCLIDAYPFKIKPLVQLAEIFILPATVVLLFMLWSYSAFEIAWQVSGEVKQIPLTLYRTGVLTVSLAFSGMLAWFFKNPARFSDRNIPSSGAVSRFPCVKNFIGSTWWFALFCCLLIIYYTVMQAFPRPWYFGPVLLYGCIVFLLAVTDILSLARKEDLRRHNAASSLPRIQWILTVPLALCIIVLSLNKLDPRVVSMRIANQNAGQWISDNLPRNAVLGSWDAGVIAYFTDQKIINLDGVVNSIEYARALKKGTAGMLLEKQGIAYLVNHGIMDSGNGRELKQAADRLFGKGASDRLRLEKTWPFTYRGSTNRFGRGIWPMAVFLYKIDP